MLIHTASQCRRYKKGATVHVKIMTPVCFVSTFFPRCPPVNLNMYPATVCNHIDAVIMCCDYDLESVKITFFTLNYIITCCVSGVPERVQ